MAIKINILTHGVDDNTPEYGAAEELKEMLAEDFSKYPNAHGQVNIGYSLTLSGQKVRDIDLLLYGEVDGYVLKSFHQGRGDYARKDVSVESFCYVIELKDHTADKVKTENTHLYVNYRGSWKDVSDQSEAQKYSFMNYFYRACGYKPFVCNIIWMRQISPASMKMLRMTGNTINVLPSVFTFSDLVHQNIAQLNEGKFHPYDDMYHINVNADGNYLDDMQQLLKERRVASGLTRRKLECLTQQSIDTAIINGSGYDKLTIFSGRAGVGKTFYLLQTALHLANSNGSRCLMLTYNHALVADIRRLLHYIGVPDKVDSYTVQIQPLHDFFIKLMKTLTGEYPEDYTDYLNRYRHCLKHLHEYVTEQLSAEDMTYLKDEEQTAIDWDYILVDEAQDWSDAEKSILFKIYGPEHIIVADGIDQFIRSGVKQHWERNVKVNAISKTMGMRQKSNLTRFVNAFAKAAKLNWEVKVNKNLLGGKVRIVSQYTLAEHEKLMQNCKANDCENYDILLLCPPRMVTRSDGESRFMYAEAVRDAGISVFDGTNKELREQYPTNVKECRLYQYDSCRGLEGWCTVCLEFDELVQYKENIYRDDAEASLALESPEDRRNRFVYLWSLMPLTRPMDTLVITLRNPDSEVGRMLHSIADAYSDFVEWDA